MIAQGIIPFFNNNPYPKQRSPKTTRDFFARFWYDRLFEIFISRYGYDAPETINGDAVLYALVRQGWVIGAEDNNKNPRIWNGFLTDQDMYGWPKELGVIPLQYPADRSGAQQIDKELGRRLREGEKACLIRLTPSGRGAVDLISMYANRLAQIELNIDVNLENVKLTRIFFAESPEQAEAYRKMIDDVTNGKVAVIENKGALADLEAFLSENGKIPVYSTPAEYLVDKLIQDRRQTLNEYLTAIGVDTSAANMIKAERNTNEEVHANDQEIALNRSYWIDTLQRDLDNFNKLFNTSFNIYYKEEATEDEQPDVTDKQSERDPEPSGRADVRDGSGGAESDSE